MGSGGDLAPVGGGRSVSVGFDWSQFAGDCCLAHGVGAAKGGGSLVSHVFISYASDDRSCARAVGAALEERGFEVWWDKERIHPSDDYGFVIREALDEAGCVVVLWSESSVVSHYVRDEATRGRDRDILVPGKIDGIEDADIPLGFGTIQYADLSRWNGSSGDSHFAELVASIEKITGAKARSWSKPRVPTLFRRRVRGRTSRWPLRIAAAATLAAVVAVAAFVLTRDNGGSSTDEAERVAVEARAIAEADPVVALLLGLESLRIGPTVEGRNAVLVALGAEPGILTADPTEGKHVSAVAAASGGDGVVATADDAGAIALWDARMRETVVEIDAHSSSIQVLRFSRDGRVLASAGADGRIRLWDGQTVTEKGEPMAGHEGVVWGLAFSFDGSRLVSGGTDGVILWDIDSRGLIARSEEGEVLALDWSSDGHAVATANGNRVVVRDAGSLTQLTRLEGHEGRVRSVAYHPEISSMLASGSEDGDVIIWDTGTGQPRAVLAAGGGAITAISFSPDGELLAAGGDDGWVRVWMVAGRPEAKPAMSFRQGFAIRGVAFVDGGLLVSGGTGGARVWDTTGRHPLSSTIIEGSLPVWSLHAEAEGSRVASGHAGGSVSLWDVADRLQVAVENATHTGVVRSVVFHPSDPLLATGDANGVILLRDSETLRALGQTTVIGPLRSLAFDPDGSQLVAGDESGLVSFFEADSLQPRAVGLEAHSGAVRAVAFGPDGSRCASAGDDGLILLWDAEDHRIDGEALAAHQARIWSVAFSPGGEWLVSTGDDGTMIVWSIETRSPLVTARLDNRGYVVAFDPAGQTIAVGDGSSIRLWDVEAREFIGQALVGHNDSVRALGFAMHGQILISGSPDGSIMAWDFRIQNLVDVACDVAGRNLTLAEWEEFRPDEPYIRLCADHPAGVGASGDADSADFTSAE